MSDSSSSRLRLPSKISRPCSAAPQKQTPSPLSPTSAMNSSTVLTEDTDSFIIGDRVWVGGTKPGSIAYIGETQFAPGDWAGVVLDEPIGKNDGSVAGSRYFQCEPKRGIFSRLTRLTRQPLSETTLPTGERTPTSSVYGSRTNLSKSMSTSLHSSVTSLSSVSQKDVTIGDRVIVSSSQGSKAGVLRFMGATQFASGEWCGVELDEPVGKNDGSVEEIRYFECRPKYGLFAPLHKVSRSPSSRRTSSTCILHKPGSSLMTTPPGRLSGSRESVKSTSSRMSTAGSSAMRGMAPGSREMLKEKQQEIEMLRHERELDRQRISRVAAQADNAERNVITLKEDYDKYKELMELQIHETQTALAQFLLENNSLKVQLEEEKQKNEDLLFRFEEGSINMDDIQVINSQNENKMKDLEKQLTEERERVIRLEQENSKLLEAQDELAKLRAELSTTENSKSQEFQDIQKTHTEASSMLEKQVLERDKLIEQYEKKLEDCEARIRNFESEIVDQTVEHKNLQEKIDVMQQSLLEKNGFIENLRKESENEVKEFQLEINRLNTMMENLKKVNNEKTNSDNIVMEKKLFERDDLIEQLKKQIQHFEAKIQSYESEAAAQTSSHNNLQQNINAMEIKLQEKSAFTEKLQKEPELNSQQAQREIEHLNCRIETITKENAEEKKSLAEQIQQQQNVVESLKKENLETKDSATILEQKLLEREKLIEKHEKYIGDCEAKIQSFESEVVDQSVLQKNLQDNIESMSQNVQEKNTLLEKLQKNYDIDLENWKKQIEQLNEEIKKIKEQNMESEKLLVEKLEQDRLITEKMAKESIEQKTAEYQVLEKQLIERMTEKNEKQMEELKGKVEKSETEVAAQTAIQKSLDEKIETLERDLLEKKTFVEKLQRENEVNGKKYQNEIQQLNEMIEKITTQSIETKNSENIVLQKQLLESKKLVEEKETKIQDYEATIEKYEINAQAEKAAQLNFQRSIEAMQINLLEKETLMENLKKEYDVSSQASQSQIDQLKSTIESITKKSNDEKESLLEQIEEKEKIIKNVTKEIEDERKSVTERIEQLEAKIESERSQRDEEKKSLVAQLEDLKNAAELAARTSDSEKKCLVEEIEQRQALIDNLSTQSNEETKSLVEQIQQLKNSNEKICEENSQEKKSLLVEIDELKKINEKLTKESNEEKKALTEQIEQLRKPVETSRKESIEEKNTLAEQIELKKKEVESLTKQKNEEQQSLLEKIQQLSKTLENATKQISEEKEPLVEEIAELKKKIENMSKENTEETKSLVDKIQEQENTIESLTKQTSEEKKLLSLEIEQLKQTNEQKTAQNLESQKSLLQKIDDQKNEMERIKKKNTEERESLLEQIDQRQNVVENLTKQSSQEKQPLVEQIERLSEMLEKIQEERSLEKDSLIEEHRKKLAEMEESSRSRLVQLEDEKSLLQTQTTDRINQIANNYKSLLNADVEIADIVQLLERTTDDIQLIVKELSVRPDRRSGSDRGGESVEESGRNVKTDEKQTLESKIPSVLKKPEKPSKGMDKVLSIPDDEALECGGKMCDDLENRILLLQGECQSSKMPNLEKQVVEMRKSINGMKKNFAILLAEEKNLEKSIAVKNCDLEKLGAAMNVIEREKHGAGVIVANANNETSEREEKTKGNSLESVSSKENLLGDFEDKTAMECLAGSEIAVKELRARFLEFSKTLKKNKNAESLVGLRETESSIRKIEEIVKNSPKCFAEKMQERSKLSNELLAQIHIFKSTLKGLTSVLNEKNNLMEVTANPSENIVSQSESNAKRIDELDHNKLEQLLADNETYKGQIDFLNSVIVDMQKKNETLTCKIEVLQLGVPANEADDYNRSTLSKRLTAPRMFCDICDQFDLHETEDCSRQAQDYEQPEPTKNSPKKSSVERPYCENCECFGHDTSECDNSETY